MSIRCFLFCTLLFVALCYQAQPKSKAVKLYDAGNSAFAKNDYRKADSLFTLSLDLEPHPDAYYNRAVCRRKLGDSKGYCMDMRAASKIGDKEAYKIFWKQCAKRDTIYKTMNGEAASAVNFDTREYVVSYNYNTNFEYEKYSRSDTLLLSKFRDNNLVVYRPCNDVKPSLYKGSTDSLIWYIKKKTDFMEKVKTNHWVNMATIELKTNESGKIIDVNMVGKENDEALEILKSLFLAMPEWNAATHLGKPVKFQSEWYLTCFDTTFSFVPHNSKGERFVSVETMPEFPGGAMEMMKFVTKNLNYPQRAKEKGLTGKCFLRFVVNSEGNVIDIDILKGVPRCPECDQEAKRVISMMPKWKPGTQKGKPVSVFFNLPINFKLLK